MKLNRKGYMLVEIILASVLAMSIAYYLLNLTYKFKNTYEDTQQSYYYMTDKILITKNIMNDLERGSVIDISSNYNSNTLTFTLTFTIKFNDGSSDEKRKLVIDGSKIQYGLVDASGNFNENDKSYYEKTLEATLNFVPGKINVSGNGSDELVTIEIPVKSIYSDEDYSIKLSARCFTDGGSGHVLLSTKLLGSYVSYGSSSIAGVNYCQDSNYSYIGTGWRLAYVKDNVPYLINAGAAYCSEAPTDPIMPSAFDDIISTSKNKAVDYCISTYAYGGNCVADTSVWAFGGDDFEIISGTNYSTCQSNATMATINSSSACGLNKNLINNGGHYWIMGEIQTVIATNIMLNFMDFWSAELNALSIGFTELGVRYVNKLDAGVYVTGGDGTKANPYIIDI